MFLLKIILLFFLSMTLFAINAQEKQDSLHRIQNSILFADILVGYSNTGKSALTAGLSIYYQTENNLFSFRTAQTKSIDKIKWVFVIPVSVVSNTTTEFAALYGRRYIEDGIGYHFASGISYNINQAINGNRKTSEVFFGVPIEVGLHFFNEKKKKFRLLYGLIPIGQPTSFGRSIGFNLYANISKRSYVGLGLTSGLGWHKKYNDGK
jgi:hypothetical protein